MNKQTTALQVIDGGRLKAAHAELQRIRLRERVVREKRVFSHKLQEIAKRHGIGYNDVVELLEEQAAADVQAARSLGFQEGLIAARFATGTVGTRRAA
jgi:hypothetical protein